MTNKGTSIMFELAKACPYWHPHLYKQVCALPIVCLHSKKTLQFGIKIGIRNKQVLNLFLNNQLWNELFNLQIWKQYVPFTDGNSEQNSPKRPIWELYVPFTDKNSEPNTPKLSFWERCVLHAQLATRNQAVLNYQFENNVFHSSDGNSEQNSPKLPIWEQCGPYGNSEQNSPKLSIWENHVLCAVGQSEQNGSELTI